MNKKTREKIRSYFHEITTIHKSPHHIATGFATGSFIGILPTPGFGVLLGVLAVFLYPKISKLALFGALALFNPFVMLPFYVLSYKVGTWLFPGQPDMVLGGGWVSTAFQLTGSYLVGNLIVGTTVAILGYGIAYWIAHAYREKHPKEEK